ncbi:YceI family protein [Dietzia sp. B32]|uniref:YceI family protein n=1 Tax=Dietzia sp. B32 TaxID=2915130 RepID=UPI0021AE043B|nr:YceI family protein [Dietzia sp. B32]UVE95100.1 YceI family protein [Dietzia sp. B32]
MRRLFWVIGVLVVVIVVVIAAPFVYKAARGGDDAPPTVIDTRDVDAAATELDGAWEVVPGTPPNGTVAGYTVDEVLRGEPVTVVGTTGQVDGEVIITGRILESGGFEVRMDGLETDISARDNRARSADILDADGHPVSTLTLAEPVDLAGLPGDGTTSTVPMLVDLTIKGTTVRRQAEVTVLRAGDQLIASGRVPVTWTEVGVQPPSLGFVTVSPDGTVDFRVVLEKS